MDNHGKYPPLERPRLMEGGGSSGGGGSNGGGGSHPPSASEYASRVSTPTTMTTLAQYHSRYGLPPVIPGSNLALMSSFINGTHSLKPRSSLLPDIQHYWNAPPETFPRYLMTGSLYPTYQPLLPGSESLSLLGAGVACVASAVTTGMGPSQPHQVAHYQQLLEIQKEAYLASMSAAASHHTAIYGISGTPLSPFLDQASASSHSLSPLSLVKQEPKEQSCSDKTIKQNERRSAAFKVDVDLNRSTRETVSISLPTLNSLNTQLKEPKLSPTSMEVSGKLDKKTSNSRASSNSANNVKMPTTPVCDSSSMPKSVSGSRHNRPTQSASSSPSPKAVRTPHQAHTSNSRRSAPQSSGCASSNQWQLSASTGHGSSMSSSPASMLEPPIISVPTKTPSPIALATVQHDGVVLSALASHSSAAASSVSTKTVFLKQQMDKVVDRAFSDADRTTTVATTVSGLSDRLSGTTQSCDRRPLTSHSNGYSDRDINSTVNGHRMDVRDQTDDSKLLSDDNSDIVVDSTESDDNPPANEPAVVTKSDHERLVEETIERVASAADSDLGSDQDEATFHNCTPSRHSSSGTSMICVTRVNTTNTVTLSGSSTATRTVYAKTQPVLSVAVSGNIPVGIAVAQIRPHHAQQSKEYQVSESVTGDTRHAHASVSTKTISTPAASLAVPASSLVVTGPAVNQSPWIQQMPFPLHPTMSSSGTTFDPSFPITAPSGFKFAQDSMTGQFFLIPSGEFVKPGGVWSSQNCAPPTETGSSHYQPTLNPTTVTIKETEKRERKHTRENNTGTSSSTASTSEKIIPAQETAPKDKPGMAGDDGKHHVKSQPSIGGSRGASSQALASSSSTTAATVLVNPVTHVSSISPAVLVKLERPTVESRGCSPIYFEDISSPLSLLSTLSCLSSVKKPATCTVGVQTCDNLMRSGCKRKRLLHNQAVQTSSRDFSTYNPLSVQCPDMDSVDPLTHSIEDKTRSDRVSYNPFTDPQILQAADGLELLSTLAEKRPKCTSLDDPKRIFPSPSDSFKSDSTSIVAFEDTLSPADAEMKSGQCTPRREILRDLSPKWSLPKKEPHTVSTFADFKTPSEIDNQEDSEVRVKLAEVQRQYKEKQKGLAKLQSKKTEESKMSKRGPGRPPKKKTSSKKSDDESSSSSSKTKEHQLPKKKKRPAEELVDRVFRKLPPVIKPSKVSRSIHYVKSKTGPFFRRKSASSSVKRNKDLFGYDESTWPSFSERKHQEKVKRCENTNDAGNIFSNLESFGTEYVEKLFKPQDYVEKICKPQDYVEKICKPQDYVEKICKPQDYVEKRGRPSKLNSHKLEKMPTSAPGTPAIKTELCSSISHQESGLGLLAKFAVTEPASSVLPLATPSSSTSSSSVNYNATSAVSSFSSNVFGSICSFVSSATSSMVSFSNHNLAAPNLNSTTSTAMMSSAFAPLAISTTSSSVTVSPTSSEPSTAMVTPAQLFPSIQIHEAVTEDSSSTFSSAAASCCLTTNSSTINIIINSPRNCCSRNSSPVSSSVTDPRDISPAKRKFEEDSDTDASDTSLNRKRKPGRPRKMNPEKSLCATETIWAKKSPNITQIQAPEPSPSQPKDGDAKKIDPSSMKPLFLDEEWTRRRSERIFLSESSPQPSPALSPAPRGEIVWKLSHFMPKSRKMLDINKSIRDGDNDKDNKYPSEDQPPSLHLDPPKSSQIPTVPSSAGMTAIKTEGKESLSWTATKTVEISTFKLEDSKKILKLEDSTQSMPLQEITKVSKSDDSEKKKMTVKKKVNKTEVPQTVTTLPTLEMKEKRAEENSKMKLQKAKSLHDLTQRVKKKFSKAGMKKQDDYQLKKSSKEGKKKRKISTDSSDADNIPLVSYKVNPPTPESRSCKLQQSDLREGLKVLYLVDGLFHEGTVKALQPPDVYGVLTAGQRGNRPHILCLEEILKWAVLDVKPDSLRYLPEGTRVCAFWSQQFSCLYPGTVAKSSPISNGKKVGISVEFDDGDNGRIELDHIRLLPSDFPIVEYEPDPLETLPKRKQRTTSDASDRRKSAETETKPSKHSKEIEEIVDNDNNSKDDTESDNTGPVAKQKLWRWEGKSTKRPGLKGKAKKVFYKAITRRKETIRVGDSAIFVSKERVNCPYIGRIESLWQGWNGQKMVRVQWYYHPEETECTKKLADPRNALFESQHEDENDVQTIAHKCEVLTFAQYKKRLSKVSKKGRSLRSNVFFVAGFYDPAAKDITFHPGVS